MENVLLGVAVVLFIVGIALAIVAAVMFVKRDIMDSIRFLQGKRVPTAGAKKRGGRRAAGGAAPKAARPSEGASERPVVSPTAGTGDDRTTAVSGGERPDDSLTTIVGEGDRADERPTTIAGARVGFIRADEGREGSETPTEVLSELGEESERPTGVLDEAAIEESERPTGVLTEEAAAEESERPTGVLVEAADEASEAETTVLGADAGDEPSEAATTVLVGEPGGRDGAEEDAPEPSEAETGVLGADEVDEPSEAVTTVLGAGDVEESERETGLLAEAGGEPAPEAGLPGVPETPASAPAAAPAPDLGEIEGSQPVEQQEEPAFRFILKQNVIVVHTEETLE